MYGTVANQAAFLVTFCVMVYCHIQVLNTIVNLYNNIVNLDCKTVRIFAYSSTREQSNKMSGMRLKTESETGERR